MHQVTKEAPPVERRVKVGIWLPRAMDRAVETIAFHREISKQRVIEEALTAYLADNPASVPEQQPA